MGIKYTKDRIIEIVKSIDNGDYELIHLDEKGSRHSPRKMQYLHKPCNTTSKKFPISEFITVGVRRCKICYPSGLEKRNRLAFKYPYVKKLIESLYGGEYTLISKEYINSSQKLKILHKTCNREFEKTLSKFKAGQKCKWCSESSGVSKTALYVYDIFTYFNIPIEDEKTFEKCRNTKTNNYLPFDYYLPIINELIEVDGEQHDRNSFGDKNKFKQLQARDKIKDEFCKKENIPLFRLKYEMWNKLPNILIPILSKCLNRDVSVDELKEIKKSTILEHIKHRLSIIHNGEYIFLDTFYSGSEREHNFKHIKCGNEFKSNYYAIKTYDTPCRVCSNSCYEKRKIH